MTPPKRKEKKSESLDVRLPYSVKQNFMAACQHRDETASAAVRRFIDAYVAETETAVSAHTAGNVASAFVRNPFRSLRLAASAALAAFAFTALPAAASQRVVAALDLTQKGTVTLGEIRGHAAEGASATSQMDEFRLTAKGALVQQPAGERSQYILSFTDIEVERLNKVELTVLGKGRD